MATLVLATNPSASRRRLLHLRDMVRYDRSPAGARDIFRQFAASAGITMPGFRGGSVPRHSSGAGVPAGREETRLTLPRQERLRPPHQLL
jgi:hypothetical protein